MMSLNKFSYATNAPSAMQIDAENPSDWFSKTENGPLILNIVKNAKTIPALNKAAECVLEIINAGQKRKDYKDLARFAADIIVVMLRSYREAKKQGKTLDQEFQGRILDTVKVLDSIKAQASSGPQNMNNDMILGQYRYELLQAHHRFAVPSLSELQDTLQPKINDRGLRPQPQYESLIEYMKGAEDIVNKNVDVNLGWTGTGKLDALSNVKGYRQEGGTINVFGRNF